MDEGREGIWFSGNGRGESAEEFRGNWRRIGRGDWAEMEASLRDAKVSLRHFLLHSLLSGIGRNAEEKEGMHRWGRSWKFWFGDCSLTLWFALALSHLLTLVPLTHTGSVWRSGLKGGREAYIRSCCWARADEFKLGRRSLQQRGQGDQLRKSRGEEGEAASSVD